MDKYIDAHCHLQNLKEQNVLINQALRAGISQFIVNATTLEDWNDVIKLTRRNSYISGAIGVHPWFVKNLPDDWAYNMQRLLIQNKNIMVGEVGLDKNYPDLQLQELVFVTQLHMAHELRRVVNIHCVGVWGSMIKILKSYMGIVVLHAFSASIEILKQMLQNENIYFSFSAAILDKRRRKLTELIKIIPMNKILVESDNDNPIIIIDIVKRIAEIKNVNLTDITDIIYKNSLRVLNDG